VATTAVRILEFARRKHADLQRSLRSQQVHPSLELSDIQGILFRGYGGLPTCRYVLLSVKDPEAAGTWLASLASEVSQGIRGRDERALHIAFTYSGLQTLGVSQDVLRGFSQPFISGMVGEHRSRLLGDVGASDPSNWIWGGPHTAPVHAVLVLYGPSVEAVESAYDVQRAHWSGSGWQEIYSLLADVRSGREHFGFTDGISQPAIAGYHPSRSALHAIRAGEFVLGYRNEYDLYTNRPLVDSSEAAARLLPFDVEGTGKKDLGRNGSYLVLRQLRQDVVAFRDTVDRLTRNGDGTPNPSASDRLAAQMVGRWPSGAPLVKSPKQDDPRLARNNEFAYHREDEHGLLCPLGAHVRRTNPRDALAPDPGTEAALVVNRRHRLVRRGRAYGPELAPGAVDHVDRGLMFVGLNGNIARQFEFVQHSWLADPLFNGFQGESDPISGVTDNNRFTVQGNPVRTRYCGLPRLVHVMGGAYCFLPGIRALRYLSQAGGSERRGKR
jgi:Dyp-type peroxidase family